jgi:hypothetical protein
MHDGLIGMWAHSFDRNGDLDQQFQIVGKSGDMYIVRIYSWDDGEPANCVAMPRSALLKLPLYESTFALGIALKGILAKRRERRERYEKQRAVIANLMTETKPAGATAH